MKFFTRSLLVIGMFSFVALPLFAQSTEEIVSTDEAVEAIESIEIRNVLSTKKHDGSLDISWDTNRLSAGAVTIVYTEHTGVVPQKVIQQRLTSRELNNNHKYNLRGLYPGQYSIFVEVVGIDMQYDSFSGIITIPKMAYRGDSGKSYAKAAASSIIFILLLIILYEVIRHRMEFAQAMNPIKKKQKPAKVRAIAKKPAVRKKRVSAKKTTPKTAKK